MAQAQLDDERAKLSSFDEELTALDSAMKSKTKRIAEEALDVQRLGHQIEKFGKDQQHARQLMEQLESEHAWIADEKESFGRANTPYDFTGQNISECKSSLKTLTERFQGMRKKINPRS